MLKPAAKNFHCIPTVIAIALIFSAVCWAVILLSLSACSNSTATLAGATSSPAITASPFISGTPAVPAFVRTSLEFYRNGKTYEVLIGYSVGRAFFYATPQPEFPNNRQVQSIAQQTAIDRYGDLDADGETEFIVSLFSCGVYCVDTIRVYDYDSQNGWYYVADEFGAKYPAVEDYQDLNGDGRLEIITANYGFCYRCATGEVALTTFAVLRYENGQLQDVTPEFPELIQPEAETYLELAQTNQQEVAYITLPAYLYNMYRLGKMDEARPVFDHVCATVIQPDLSSPDHAFDCAQFRAEVEADIVEFQLRP